MMTTPEYDSENLPYEDYLEVQAAGRKEVDHLATFIMDRQWRKKRENDRLFIESTERYMMTTRPERTPPRPLQKPGNTSTPRPPRPKYLPMRFVTWQQHGEIWPSNEGVEYPTNNREYPMRPLKWTKNHDNRFLEWLQTKGISAKWFHQDSSREEKRSLLWEFAEKCDDLREIAPLRNHWLLRFIDWLNEKVGADKPKQKHTTEQMTKLSDLFDGYEDAPIKRSERQPSLTPYTKG